MSTRSIIARGTQATFEGRYHHWDGYPEGLGKSLWDLYHGHFQGDLDAMLKVLIDDHPAGWSTIEDKDFSLPAGYTPFECQGDYSEYAEQLEIFDQSEDGRRPQCYCHGQRRDKPSLITSLDGAPWCEYAYLFDVSQHHMIVQAKRDNTWGIIAIDLKGDEPNWSDVA